MKFALLRAVCSRSLCRSNDSFLVGKNEFFAGDDVPRSGASEVARERAKRANERTTARSDEGAESTSEKLVFSYKETSHLSNRVNEYDVSRRLTQI